MSILALSVSLVAGPTWLQVGPIARAAGWILLDHARSATLKDHLIQLRNEGFSKFRLLPGPMVEGVGPFRITFENFNGIGAPIHARGWPIRVVAGNVRVVGSEAWTMALSEVPRHETAEFRQNPTVRTSSPQWKKYGQGLIEGLSAAWGTPVSKSFTPLVGWDASWATPSPARLTNRKDVEKGRCKVEVTLPTEAADPRTDGTL